MKYFPDELRTHRQKKGISQKEIAEHLGVNSNTISNYENGKSEPDLVSLDKIIKILEIVPNDLFEYRPKYAENDIEPSLVFDNPAQPPGPCPICAIMERLIKSKDTTIDALQARINDLTAAGQKRKVS